MPARDEYEEFCDGVRKLTGIDLSQYKRQQMERRIRALVERRGERELLAYLKRLNADQALLDEFLDRVTINVSQLWRNPEQWVALTTSILPELARTGSIKAWSAGSSYGAEAYTIAAVCGQTAARATLEVTGSDIDRRMIERARYGWFSRDDARSAPPEQLRRWFEPENDGWRARAELRRNVRFEIGDLLRDRPRQGHYDLVMCRNVVIYFTQPVRDELHARLASSLRPGGYLMVGSSERVTDPAALELENTHPFIYRRV